MWHTVLLSILQYLLLFNNHIDFSFVGQLYIWLLIKVIWKLLGSYSREEVTLKLMTMWVSEDNYNYNNLLYFILPNITLSYLFILNYYIIWYYLCISKWCDTQCCCLSYNIYHYHSIITLISVWYDSSILCCWWRSFGNC